MADRTGLGVFGYVLGGVTIAVMLMAFTVVMAHLDGSLALESSPTTFAAVR